jgi:hypothetical protein
MRSPLRFRPNSGHELTGTVVLSGILKWVPGPAALDYLLALQARAGMTPLPPHQLHITLLHQKATKELGLVDYVKKGNVLPPPPPVGFSGEVLCTDKSTFVPVDDYTQGILEVYVRSLLFDAGASLDNIRQVFAVNPGEFPPRTFHVSLSNATGNPGDSAANVTPFMPSRK